MNKTVLILDSSLTTQKQFTKRLNTSLYDLKFITSANEFISKAFEIAPDAILISSDIKDASSYELVKLLRSIKCFKDVPIAMYSSTATALGKEQSLLAGANTFIHLEETTIDLKIAELTQVIDTGSIDKAQVEATKAEFDDTTLFLQSMKVWDKETTKNAIFNEIFNLQRYCSNIKEVIRGYLSLIAQICEVPVVSMYIIENDGPHAYIIHTPEFKGKEFDDFHKVSITDFDEVSQGISVSGLVPETLEYDEEKINLTQFYTQRVRLSSYETTQLRTQDGKPFATLHTVCEGNLTKDKVELFNYVAEQAGLLFENCIEFKRKLFYEEKSRKAFSRFVPEEIIDDLINKSDSKEDSIGEERQIAIISTDIRSFTSISEKNKPEVIVNFLNRYFTIMCNIIRNHGGEIDKFVGDAIQAKFGTPTSYDDNASRAVTAGYEMRDAIATVPLEDLVMPDGMVFNIGIGINYGNVIAGSIGSKDKTDYTIIGESVNLAEELESQTKNYGCQLMVSESVREQIMKEKEAREKELREADDLNDESNKTEMARKAEILSPHDSDNDFVFRQLDYKILQDNKAGVPIYAIDRSINEFSPSYRESYKMGLELYNQGNYSLARENFEKAKESAEQDKAVAFMISKCNALIEKQQAG